MTGASGLMSAGPPTAFNILKERLRASGSSGNTSKDSNQSPFVMTPFGHPGFNPQKVGKSTDSKPPKAPKPPEKPLMPYMRYSRKVWDEVKAQHTELKLWEIGKIIGQMWRDLPENEKNEYIDDYETEKVEYERNLKIYHSSPAYLAYMATKAKNKSTQQTPDERDSHERSSKLDRRLDIQPAEDDDEPEDHFSLKHIAYSRYMRNHRLINEIFSDSIVPGARGGFPATRMQVLCRQLQSLTCHLKKLEADHEQMIEKFETTKRKFEECNEAFQLELKKHCQRAVDEEMFQKMVERQMEIIKKEKLKGLVVPPAETTKKESCAPVAVKESSDNSSSSTGSDSPSETTHLQGPDNKTPLAKEESDSVSPKEESNDSVPPKDGSSITSLTKDDLDNTDIDMKQTPAGTSQISYLSEQRSSPCNNSFNTYSQVSYPTHSMPPVYTPGYNRFPGYQGYPHYHHGNYQSQHNFPPQHQYPNHHFIPPEVNQPAEYINDSEPSSTDDKKALPVQVHERKQQE